MQRSTNVIIANATKHVIPREIYPPIEEPVSVVVVVFVGVGAGVSG